MPKPSALTNLQRELLRIGALELPDEELKEVKLLLARYFAQKASGEFESFARERGLSSEETDTWAFEHFRKLTPPGEQRTDDGRQEANEPGNDERYPLRGSVLRYDRPFDPAVGPDPA